MKTKENIVLTKQFAEDIDIIEQAATANPWWFKAIIAAASVMSDRVKKYSTDDDPYLNFQIMLQMLGHWFRNKYNIEIDMRDVFVFYEILKMARHIVSGSKDYADESSTDTRVDEINYYALDLGDMLRKANDDK